VFPRSSITQTPGLQIASKPYMQAAAALRDFPTAPARLRPPNPAELGHATGLPKRKRGAERDLRRGIQRCYLWFVGRRRREETKTGRGLDGRGRMSCGFGTDETPFIIARKEEGPQGMTCSRWYKKKVVNSSPPTITI
jgi:hypothetical protein